MRVCEVILDDPKAYFARNPLCIPQYCEGPLFECNENYCPPEHFVPPAPPVDFIGIINNLTNRVKSLELRVGVLENINYAQEQRISYLESNVNILINSFISLRNTVNNILTNLFGLPRGLQEQMVCSTLLSTNQTNATGFGLTCSINEKGACECV